MHAAGSGFWLAPFAGPCRSPAGHSRGDARALGQPRPERQHPFGRVMPAAQPRAATGAGTAPGGATGPAGRGAVPAFGCVQPDGAQRRQKRRSLAVSLVVQVGLWLVLFWSFGRAQFASPRWQAAPEKLTWLTAPVLPHFVPPPAGTPRPALRAHREAPRPRPLRARRRSPRPLARRGRPRVARLRRAPQVSPPVFVARAAAPTAPDPVSQPAVVMAALPRAPDPRPPRPVAAAAVRLGAFADPPAAARGRAAPVAAGPRVGAFGAAAGAAAPPVGAARPRPSAAVRLGGFHPAAPPSGPASAPEAVAAQVNTRVFHPVAAVARRLAPAAGVPLAAYSPPVILFKPQPVYPAAAQARGMEGVVVLRVALTAAGRVRVLAVERSLGRACDQAARQAALRIRFRPARRYGRPVDAVVRIRVRFRVAD